jgi:hypothetical protein
MFIIILVIANILVCFNIVANLTGFKTDILNINPPDKLNSVYMTLLYPSTPDNNPRITFKNLTDTGMSGLSLSVNMYLSYNGTLVENTPVTLMAAGSLYPEGQQFVSSIFVGIEGSTYYHADSASSPQFNLPFTNESILTEHRQGVPALGVVYWRSQGDYYPVLTIAFRNQTEPLVVNYNDAYHKIYEFI